MKQETVVLSPTQFLFNADQANEVRSPRNSATLSVTKTGNCFLSTNISRQIRSKPEQDVYYQLAKSGGIFYLLISRTQKPSYIRAYKGRAIGFAKSVGENLGIHKKQTAQFIPTKVKSNIAGVKVFKLTRFGTPSEPQAPVGSITTRPKTREKTVLNLAEGMTGKKLTRDRKKAERWSLPAPYGRRSNGMPYRTPPGDGRRNLGGYKGYIKKDSTKVAKAPKKDKAKGVIGRIKYKMLAKMFSEANKKLKAAGVPPVTSHAYNTPSHLPEAPATPSTDTSNEMAP